MLKAYLIDDEIKAVELLKNYVEKIDFIELVGEARNPMKAFHYLQENEVDVLFLDINMPVLTGLELYKSLRNPPAVIFTTAHGEHAVEGFNLEALDYLLKPISFPRFLQACQRLAKSNKPNDKASPTSADFDDLIYVKSGPTTHKLSWKEVLYLEKDENYVIYHTKEKRILTRQTLSDLEEFFPTYICRIHKSYAVSLLQLNKVERELVQILDKELPVGRTYKNRLLSALKTFKG